MGREPIYKYHRNDENLLKLLKGNYVWLSSPMVFNDPFDFHFSVPHEIPLSNEGQLVADEIERLDKLGVYDIMSPGHTKRKEQKLNEVRNELAKHEGVDPLVVVNKMETGVCCFSKTGSNLLMWSHYTENHRGVCLEIRLSDIDESKYKILEVQYTNKYPKLYNPNKDGMRCMSTKFKDWEYEQEVRLLSRYGPGKYKFNKSDLIGITFGCRMKDEERKTIMKLVRTLDYPDVQFYQAKQNPKAYKLDIEQIS